MFCQHNQEKLSIFHELWIESNFSSYLLKMWLRQTLYHFNNLLLMWLNCLCIDNVLYNGTIRSFWIIFIIHFLITNYSTWRLTVDRSKEWTEDRERTWNSSSRIGRWRHTGLFWLPAVRFGISYSNPGRKRNQSASTTMSTRPFSNMFYISRTRANDLMLYYFPWETQSPLEKRVSFFPIKIQIC